MSVLVQTARKHAGRKPWLHPGHESSATPAGLQANFLFLCTGPSLAKKELGKNGKLGLSQKMFLFIIQVEIKEVWRCPG